RSPSKSSTWASTRRSVPNWGLVPTLIAAGRARPSSSSVRWPGRHPAGGGGKGEAGRGLEVGRRDAQQGAAAVVALDHHALHGVGAAKGGGRRGHVAGGELGAD